jgi:hypothetical protein
MTLEQEIEAMIRERFTVTKEKAQIIVAVNIKELTKAIVETVAQNADQHPEEGDPCSACGEELLWDDAERMVYCLNDWQHG